MKGNVKKHISATKTKHPAYHRESDPFFLSLLAVCCRCEYVFHSSARTFPFNSNDELRESINRLVNIFYILFHRSFRKQPLHCTATRFELALSLCSRIVHLQIVYYSIYKLELCERCDTTRMCNASKSNMNRNCCCLLFSLSHSVGVSLALWVYICLFLIVPPYSNMWGKHTPEKGLPSILSLFHSLVASSYGFQLFSDMSHFNLNQSFYGMTEWHLSMSPCFEFNFLCILNAWIRSKCKFSFPAFSIWCLGTRGDPGVTIQPKCFWFAQIVILPKW